MNNDRKFGENNLDAISLIAAILIVIQHSVNHLGIRFLVYNPGDRWWQVVILRWDSFVL